MLALEQMSSENKKLKSKSLKENKTDLKSIMQAIYNECPVLDHKDS